MSLIRYDFENGTVERGDEFLMRHVAIKARGDAFIVTFISSGMAIIADCYRTFTSVVCILGIVPELPNEWLMPNTDLRWRVVWASQRFVDGDHAICMRVARFLGAVV